MPKVLPEEAHPVNLVIGPHIQPPSLCAATYETYSCQVNMTKRHLTWLAVALLLGVIANCGVALACTLRAQAAGAPVVRMTETDARPLLRRSGIQLIKDYDRKLNERGPQCLRKWVPERRHLNFYGSGRLESLGYREMRLGVFTGIILSKDDRNYRDHTQWTFNEIDAGWPLPSFRRWDLIPEIPDYWFREYSHANSRTGVQSMLAAKPMLPMSPLWLGFALNSVFYAMTILALVLALSAVPVSLRHLVRRRRGLCPRCAYPIGASINCSECGELLEAVVNEILTRKPSREHVL